MFIINQPALNDRCVVPPPNVNVNAQSLGDCCLFQSLSSLPIITQDIIIIYFYQRIKLYWV